ncbi:molybdenum cofactor guanylyltransferase [Parasulfuritortus cantonensis]|uniref:Molybdenum cofactor guanylyltransferase n=1 Tax=Parasulfuritortus cantonensis TaxID=2528202 RepID=A0A4R1B847_9PROT|nr:molybdenum cofactor guanylyltransferase MobA [Parasulfuritortus cantonensis]TCJ12958.1 molybdenum cofactor guanylyltransferase [Parasulfuritortus cantonensis]
MTPAVAAVVLAGGRGRRMDARDKGLVELGGRPLVAWVVERLRPQVGEIVVSANRNLAEYARLGCPVVPDDRPDQPGPLAGILAAGRRCSADWLLVAPCDTPFLPADLVARLLGEAAARGVALVRAGDPERVHYAVMLMRRSLLDDLAAALAEGERRVQGWQARHPHADVRFAEAELFFNVNDAAQLARAEVMARSACQIPDID